MSKDNTYRVIFTNNEIASVKRIDEPKFTFPEKVYIFATRFHLILAFIKAQSISKAIQEAKNIVKKFLNEG